MSSTREVRAEDILYIFDRPTEPIFFPKGEGKKNVLFVVPSDMLESRFQSVAADVRSRFGEAGELIEVPNIGTRLPNLSIPLQLKKDQNFSLFIDFHREIADYLINMFMKMANVKDLLALVAVCVGQLNPYLLNYALSVALLHRPDTKHLDLPTLFESFPNKFLHAPLISRAREEASIFSDKAEERTPVIIPKDFTASDLDPEHRLWYFREDLGINLHHWHWHLVYPLRGPLDIVQKDRRGELFYYMHQQVIVRYNCERFCNKLYHVQRLLHWNEPILEGYFPKLSTMVSSANYPSRSPNTKISDINRKAEHIQIDIHDLERWRDRIYEAIHQGYILKKSGERMTLSVEKGIDILGNIVESCILSENPDYYGDLHNKGHMLIAYIHDSDHRYLEDYGVMGESSTAMRDPVFYRWHAFINDIFQEYKRTLPPYTSDELAYKGIQITKLEISSVDGTKNEFNTFWQRSNVNLSKGMDFIPRGDVLVEVIHLQHKTFTYTIEVENTTNRELKGTIRIFLAPHYDERGEEMMLNDQRTLFAEMDKFTWTFQPNKNIVKQSSRDSSVIIPFERTFRDLNASFKEDSAEQKKFNFCGCGWPEHMLIPKGTPEGYPCQLFVMISNYEDDKVEQTIDTACADAASYCGIRDKKYPDKRAMGFPFDRQAELGTYTLSELKKDYPNMFIKDINIKFTDKIVDRYG